MSSENLKKRILEAFTRDGFLEQEPVSLQEYEEQNPDDGWEYETLEEFLADQYLDEELNEGLYGDQKRQFEIGDIIFVNAYYSPSSRQVVKNSSRSTGTSGHKILVITSKENENGIVDYRGFALTSNVSNSNKNGGYNHKIHIDNYGSILSTGPKSDKEAAINVNELIKCNSRDLSTTGSYKGHVSDEFLEFIQQAYSNYRSGKDTSKMIWREESIGNGSNS